MPMVVLVKIMMVGEPTMAVAVPSGLLQTKSLEVVPFMLTAADIQAEFVLKRTLQVPR